MKKILFCVLLSVAFMSCQAQSFTRIEFTTLTRGYQKQIVITSKEITVTIDDSRSGENKKPETRRLKKADWKKLTGSLKGVSIQEIPDLASPTMNRASDGARSSSLIITTEEGNAYTHTFDNENPNKKLIPLMKVILSISDGTK